MKNFLNYLVKRLDLLKNQQHSLSGSDDIVERGKSFYFAQEIRRLEAIYAEARQIIGFVLEDSSIIFEYTQMCGGSDSSDSDSISDSESDIDEFVNNENDEDYVHNSDGTGFESDVGDDEDDLSIHF